jgi:hypothetical protein
MTAPAVHAPRARGPLNTQHVVPGSRTEVETSAPDRIRTYDPRLRRPPLCPTELRAQNPVKIGALGFEPRTSCSQSRRATELRHAPSGTKLFCRNNVRRIACPASFSYPAARARIGHIRRPTPTGPIRCRLDRARKYSVKRNGRQRNTPAGTEKPRHGRSRAGLPVMAGRRRAGTRTARPSCRSSGEASATPPQTVYGRTLSEASSRCTASINRTVL